MVINPEQMVLSLAPKCSPLQPLLFITGIPRALRTAPKFCATRCVMNDQGRGWEWLSNCVRLRCSAWSHFLILGDLGHGSRDRTVPLLPQQAQPLGYSWCPQPRARGRLWGPADRKEPAPQTSEGRSRVQQSL